MQGSIIIYLGNYTATAGPTIPIFGGIPIAPLAGSFLGIVVSVIIAIYTINRHKDATEKHIDAVKNASSDQIKDARHWRDQKRKQQIKSLIKELEMNMALYQEIFDDVQEGRYLYRQNDFKFILMEKCLSDTPIDDDQINSNLINMYDTIKLSQNFIAVLHDALAGDGVRRANDRIAKIYTDAKPGLELIIGQLKQYEERINNNQQANQN